MKRKRKLFTLHLAMVFTMVLSTAMAADYYVVIGTFAEEGNARRYMSEMSTQFAEAAYSFNGERKVYYVHVLRTTVKDEADGRRRYLREQKGFKDAWIFADWNARLIAPNFTVAKMAKRERAPRLEATTSFLTTSGPMIASTAAGSYLSYKEEKIVKEEDIKAEEEVKVFEGEKEHTRELASVAQTWESKWGINYIPEIRDGQSLLAAKEAAPDNLFTFVVEDHEGKEIETEVMLVDFEKARRIAGFNTGEHAAIRGTRREQMFTLVCDVLGYAQETRMYNIDHLSRGRDIRKNEEGVWEVHFKLKKMELHDIAFLNRTTFYPDGAVPEPSSREEMQALAELMQKNPTYKIVLHGHCNPVAKRDIKVPGKGQDAFSIEQAESVKGSDKKLAKARANVVKKFLVDRGIDSKRIGVVGWGSLEPLVSTSGPDAKLNDRVEFELVGE